jgi:hypothetical protein
MKSIGGYFEIELNDLCEYHTKAILLNTARNALEYVLRVNMYKKILIPYFTCEVILEPIKKLEMAYEYYHIDENFEPLIDYTLIDQQTCILYTNYFGLKDNFIKHLSSNISNLIIDNAQSFFSKQIKGVNTFYSARKFFGVSDGAYLFCNKHLSEIIEQDTSINRMAHLLIRADKNPEEGYSEFIKNDSCLINQPIKKMSSITHKILRSIDYENVKIKRKQNFEYLHQQLKSQNILNWDINDKTVPMVYPFWTTRKNVREKLIKNKIYVPKYWASVLNNVEKTSLENKFVNEIICLPIDQRYGLKEMKYLITQLGI